MTIALVQQPAGAYNGGTVSLGNTFSIAPTSGNLIVFTVIAANNATITADDGTLTEVQTGYETFRRISTFAKIAGGSEPVTYDFTISTSSTCWVYATEYSTTDTWAAVTSGVKTIDFDSTGSNFEITSTGIATTAGSLLVASGYSGNSTTNNQEINAGFSNFVQPLSTGTTRRTAQADKTSLGGSQTAEFSLTDEATSTRLAVSLVEFPVTVLLPTVSITQQPAAAYNGAATSLSNTFSSTPTTGNLLVFTVAVANNATITPVDGSLVEIQTGYETFRRISTFAKIASGSEPATYDFNISLSSTAWVYATEYETDGAWDVVTSGNKTIDFDSSGSNFEITSSGIITEAGSLLVASGYSGNSTTNNQEINTGFSNFIQPISTGNTRRTAQADKASAGGSQTAEYSLTDETLNARLAISLSEFRIIVGGPTLNPVTTTPTDGDAQTFSTSGMTAPITSASFGGVDILSNLSNLDPETDTSFTIDVSATEASQGRPRIGETATLSVTTSEGTATADVVLQPKSDWAVETLVDPLAKDTDDLLALADTALSITTVATNLIYYSNARGEVIDSSGGYEGGTTLPFQSTAFVIQQGGSATTTATSVGGLFYPFKLGGPVVTPRISYRNLSFNGLTYGSIRFRLL